MRLGAMTADRTETTVLVGGSIRTLDPERPLAAALVLEGERIAAVLDDPADAPAGATRLDLAGACVVPGLVDAHVHFPSWALARRELGCSTAARWTRRSSGCGRRPAALRAAAGCAGAVGATSCGATSRHARRSTRSRPACASRCAPTTATPCG